MLIFLHEKFGITPKDVENYDMNWINLMTLIANAEGEAKQIIQDKITQSGSPGNTIINPITSKYGVKK